MRYGPDESQRLDPAVRAYLDAALTTRRIAGGEMLYEAGALADGIAIVTRGQLSVLDDAGKVVSTLTSGDIVGEIAAISGLPRTRTVVATRDTELRAMSQEQFDELVLEHPLVGREVSRIVAVRLINHGNDPLPTRPPSTLAIVRGDESVDLQQLVDALDRVADDVAVFTEADAEGKTANERMGSLDRLEDRNELTILDGGVIGTDAEWLDLCVRQADTVMIAVPAHQVAKPPKPLIEFAGRLAKLRTVTELVVVNPANAVDPVDATDLRALLAPERLHHIRSGEAASADRLARLALGEGTALVLSGGGAKGLAHIGVWRAINELGIEIDAVAGVSFGAIMAWGIALEYSAEKLIEVTNQRLITAKRVKDPTIPFVSILRGGGVRKQLSDISGERTFDQLWRPLVVCSTDLTTGSLIDHTTGPVWRGVRASMSIPGIFPPIRSGLGLLVDGAVRDNMPINSIRANHPLPLRVIAVDVGDHGGIEPGTASEDGAYSGWRQLRTKTIRRKEPSAPSMVNILLRIMDLSGLGSGGKADTLIVPNLEGYGPGDFKRMDELIQLGYEAAMAELA